MPSMEMPPPLSGQAISDSHGPPAPLVVKFRASNANDVIILGGVGKAVATSTANPFATVTGSIEEALTLSLHLLEVGVVGAGIGWFPGP